MQYEKNKSHIVSVWRFLIPQQSQISLVILIVFEKESEYAFVCPA